MKQALVVVGILLCVSREFDTAGSGESAGGAGRRTSNPVLVLPGSGDPIRLRLDLLVEGQAPDVAWETFLDLIFDWFDRDGDGSLSRAEAARIFPLPRSGRSGLSIDFDKLDADRDGKGSRAELKAYCRANGFGPIVTILEPPTTEDARLADLFHRRLAGADGKLTRSELKHAPGSLRRCDLNEDGYLDLSELLASASTGLRADNARISFGASDTREHAVLRLDVSDASSLPKLEGHGGTPLRLVAAPVPDQLHPIYGVDGQWLISVRNRRNIPDIRSAGEFLIAQFKDALVRDSLSSRPALSKADVQNDSGLSGLVDLFRYADKNGDDQLTPKELTDYLRLVELGVQSQIWIHVKDHGRNPFQLLDSDGDSRLSYREQLQSANLLLPDAVEALGLPLHFHVAFIGPMVKSWGGVPVPAVVRRRPEKTAPSSAPAWFQAMDRNGDGVISPREFLGPPELFRKLDTDGDGVISPEEAAHAGRP